MDKKAILRLITKEEGNELEFKVQFNDSVLKTISAFANTIGGLILIGVNNKKEVVGIDLNDKDFQRISNKVVDELGFTPDFEIANINNKSILIIKVKKSSIPISYKGKYYKRVGNTTREMNFQELKRFFQKDLRWERLSDNNFSIDEIDENTVRDFLRTAKSKGRLTVFNGDEPVKEIFEKLGLMEKGKIKNAGILLFGKNPQKYFDQAKVRVIRLKDNISIIGDRWIEGNLFNQFRETEEAIKNFINVKYEIKGFNREDIWDYPLEAIREAIANAILHKDYLRPVVVQVKVYDDKIWFFNKGGLPEEWDVARLFDHHSSEPRNPIVFNIFYLVGIVESVGSGIERIIKALKEAGLPSPKIEANHIEFNLWMMKDFYTVEYLRDLGLNERQIKAVMYVKERGIITNREYQEINNCFRNTATNDLRDLVKRNILKESGKRGAGSFYKIAQ